MEVCDTAEQFKAARVGSPDVSRLNRILRHSTRGKAKGQQYNKIRVPSKVDLDERSEGNEIKAQLLLRSRVQDKRRMEVSKVGHTEGL